MLESVLPNFRIVALVLATIATGHGQGTPAGENPEPAQASAPRRYAGRYCAGEGDVEFLRLIDESFACFHPNPVVPNLTMIYQPEWDTFLEAGGWNAWWIQNSYGFSYAATPFLQEPWFSMLQRSWDLFWDNQGDGKRMGLLGGKPDSNPPLSSLVAPDGCLGDCALPGQIAFRQGDGEVKIHDWFYEATAAGLVMQAEILLISRDPQALARYFPKMERACEFIEKARDPKNNLFLVGPACNLLAPSYGGVKQPDGSFGKGYLAGLSITYLAALDRIVELYKLAGDKAKLAQYEHRQTITRQSLPQLLTPTGYFVKSVEPGGVKHGVLGQEQFAYLEGVANADAVALRVVDDLTAASIYQQIAAFPAIRPFDFLLANAPGLDDTYWSWGNTSGPEFEEYKQFGNWVNGGAWSTVEGRAILMYYRLGKFEDIRRSATRAMKWAKDFRMDSPWSQRGANTDNSWYDEGKWLYGTGVKVTADHFAIPAATIRGLFDYDYRSDRLILRPRIPGSITQYTQKEPIRFGKKTLYLSCQNGGPKVKSVRINGRATKAASPDAAVFLYNGMPDAAQVEIITEGAWPKEPATVSYPAIPALTPQEGLESRPTAKLPESLTKPFAALTSMAEALTVEPDADDDRAFVAAALQACEARRTRETLEAGPGYFRAITPQRKTAILKFYEQSALAMYQGFAKRMADAAASGDPRKKRLTALFNAVTIPTGESDMAQVEQRFRELPMDSRRLIGPLFWLHGDESKERLEMYVAKVAEGGNGCFTVESRPHNDWLGPNWYRDLAICRDAAKKHHLQMAIYDEKWMPSGEVAGKVPQQYGSKRMDAQATDIAGPKRVTAPGYDTHLIAVIAGQEMDGGIDGQSLIDLSGCVTNGTLTWEAPAGRWKVMKFTWKFDTAGHVLVDGASRDSVDWFIKTVYQPHYDHFNDDFGKTITGYFFDEPHTQGDWGTEVLPMLKERKADWKKALVAWKFTLAGEEQVAARYQYQDAFAEAWGRTLYGGLSNWCREHQARSTGHFLEHMNLYLSPDLCAGNLFQLMKYCGMGGIDAVFTQFRIGQRVAQDPPCWQTPKLGSSITHAYGKPDDITMVEIFGARGQDLTYPEMKWWADHMQVSGANFLIPHSFNPKAPYDTDCPPYFYNGGFEPRWPLYRIFADYNNRLGCLLTGGHHVAPVALLYLGNSSHAGKYVTPEQMSESLQDALFDCDWLPYDVLENDTTLAARELKLRDESYKVLIVPTVEVIPYATLEKARAFFDAGGVVVGCGFLPTKSATLGRASADITQLREAIWGLPQPGLAVCKTNTAGGRSYLLPEKPTPGQIQQVLTGDAGVHPTLEVLQGRTDNWLHVLHRVKSGRDVFFITHQNHLGEARKFRLRLTAGGEPECWDAMRNELTFIPYQRDGESAVVDLTLEPSESIMLVFQPAKRLLPARLDGDSKPLLDPIKVVREAVAEPPAPVLTRKEDERDKPSFEGCKWLWYPEGDVAGGASLGSRYFRKQVVLPADRKIRSAAFRLACDNDFALFINGRKVDIGAHDLEGWQQPIKLDLKGFLQPGPNQLALEGINGSGTSIPAGLIGRLVIEFDQGDPLDIRPDRTWKAANKEQSGWPAADFDDSKWLAAAETAEYGNTLLSKGAKLTLSPVKADPFQGQCDIPASVDLIRQRVCLMLDSLVPEAAARVTVNGHDAGGFIGKPLRLDVTKFVKAGGNTIRIEPFAPKSAQLLIFE
jgi:hypothetical protein